MKKYALLCTLSFIVSFSFAQWGTYGTNIYNTNTGGVGIGIVNPVYPLEVNGAVYTYGGLISNVQTTGAIAGHFRGATNGNANVVLQGNVGVYNAFWLTATNTLLKIGGIGGTEPSAGALNIDNTGNVGIGTTTTGSFKLAVEGKIGARELKVTLASPWPDYVFYKQYKLLSLKELETFLNINNHLPNIPSAEEVKKDGINVGDMNARLLEKVEELTLYVIQLSKENESIKEQLKKLSEKK